MKVRWFKVGRGLFSATVEGLGGLRYNLIVERMPGRGWDWAMWCATRPQIGKRDGATRSAKAGMAAAERAATARLAL